MKVNIENLTVGFKDDDHFLLALDRVDLDLQPGRITALVGESGSGKTTLGNALMGLLPDNASLEGKIRLDQVTLTDLDEVGMNRLRGSKVSMMFQDAVSCFNPVYRLVDQVAEPLIQHLGMASGPALKKAVEQLEAMGLSSACADRFPHELSGGQVQRALMAMTLILDPEVLILDEPTASLDAMTGQFVSGIINKLAGRDKSILLITHDLDLASRLADDIAVLYLGQIMEYLPAKRLFQPRHPYTRALGRSFPGMDIARDLGGIRGDAFYRLVHAHPRENGTDHSHTHVVAAESDHHDGHAPPDGCLFQPRCTQAKPLCNKGDMPFVHSGAHRVRCVWGGIVEHVRMEGVSRSYGEVRALYPTDLTIWAGEVFCLVGETGSGKTTLAMISSGALVPDHGQVIFDSQDMAAWMKRDYQSLAAEVGVVYQNPAAAVSHRLSVLEIVAEPLRIQKPRMPETDIRKKVSRALADVRLPTQPEFMNRFCHELNMGAVQRLCIARALVHGPSLLVADEPTSALDPSVQAKVLKMLLGLQIEKGLTLLFVTHDIGLARKIADRIGVMLAGRMVETGPAACILNRPLHPYTAMLVGSAAGLNAEASSGLSCMENDGKADRCPFYDRCDRRVPDCQHSPGPVVTREDGLHRAWCHSPLPE